MAIPKLNHWSMELSDYSLMLVYIKGSNIILGDAISRLKRLGIYKEPLDKPKTSNTMICNAEMVSSEIQTLSADQACAKQKRDIH